VRSRLSSSNSANSAIPSFFIRSAKNTLGIPTNFRNGYGGNPGAVVERSYLAFRNSAWLAIATGFLEPVLYLISFGYGVGHLIGKIAIHHGASTSYVSYAAYLAPALLATSAMNGAIYDATWNVFFKLKFDRIYQAMLATSLGPVDVALGEIAWALIRGLAYGVAFLIVVFGAGLIHSPLVLLALPAATLISFAFAACGMAATTYCDSFEQMNLIAIILLPMFLFSGSFAPISLYPRALQWIIQALPLWHGIDLMRAIFLNQWSLGLIWHLIYFLALAAIGLAIVSRRLTILFLR
jgi:lipooligosaccharide transport system permease protein